MDILNQLQWVPKTKFNPPLSTADELPRTRLLEMLQRELPTRRLTILSAPAGSGKTTLIAQFVRNSSQFPCAWLRLGPEDDEPTAFLVSLLASIQQVLPSLGQRAATLLDSLPDISAHWRQIVGMLINDLVESDLPIIVLVLDDYNYIENADVHEVCSYLLEHMPPSLHLIVTTRTDPPLPLARLRMRGELNELRLFHLRFDAPEIKTYFKQLWRIDLAPDELEGLQRRTEGWVAGLHLLAMTLSRLTDPGQRAAFIAEFSRSNRLIFQLLAEEVLAHQPPDMRDFLLETSILTELTPALCAAVTDTSEAPDLLAEAYRRNLFLTAVDDQMSVDTAYRYHGLFAAFLQRQLAQNHPNRLRDLHRRAALAHPDPDEQVRHFLAANEPTEAADVLETIGRAELQRRNVRRQSYEQILALPDTVRDRHAWLLLTLGAYHAQRGQFAAAAPFLNQAERVIEAGDDELAEIELLIDRAWMEGNSSDETLAAINAKLESVPHLFTPAQQAVVHSTAEWHYMMRFDWPNVTRHVLAGVDLALHSDNDGATSMFAQAFGPELFFNDRGVAAFEPLVRHLNARAEANTWPVQLNLHLMRGWMAYFQARPADAERECRAAQHVMQFGTTGWTDGHVACLELSLLRWRGKYARLLARVEEILTHLAADTVSRAFAETLFYFQGQSALLQGRVREAGATYTRLREQSGQFYFSLYTEVQMLLLGGQVALAERRGQDAETLLRQAADLHRRTRSAVWYPHPRLALARLYHERGDPAQALDELQAVLADIDRFQTPGMLLQEGPVLLPVLDLATDRNLRPDLITPVLALFAQAAEPHPVDIPDTTERLTPREVEVLHLLATGASNRLIAEELVITERTVKAHVSNLLAKLAVSSRGEAVARARELHLI